MSELSKKVLEFGERLTCGHCQGIFAGSNSQTRRAYYEKATVYCGAACRHSALREKFRTDIPARGPCKHCGVEFSSRTAKKYCSIKCYTSSDAFKETSKAALKLALTDEAREKQAKTARTGHECECKECGILFYRKKQSTKIFCSRPCYRSYFAKRFDRHVANPEGMALPQCYDEFLDKELLSCPVDGCSWKGLHLTLHANYTHGMRSREFKRATGFNLGSGLIAKPLARAFSDRELRGVALDQPEGVREMAMEALEGVVRYRSKEAAEHQTKFRADAVLKAGPQRNCAGCNTAFRQSTIFGRAKYCSVECRENHYSLLRKKSRPTFSVP